MQYALLIYEDETLYGPGKKGPALQEIVSRHMAFNRELGAKRVGGSGLTATSSATTIRTKARKALCARWTLRRGEGTAWRILSDRSQGSGRSDRHCEAGFRCFRTVQSKSGQFLGRDGGAALERVFREASGRIVGALAARFVISRWPRTCFPKPAHERSRIGRAKEVPTDPAAWLYQVAARAALDGLRRRQTHIRFESQLSAEFGAQPADVGDDAVIPDERLRLIFICCHPAVGVDARAALTLRLVCGLSTLEIARAFLVSETTMAQRLTRAKGKIADAGVPFELPAPQFWPERLDAVLATVEIAYGKAHEDAAASGPHAHFAAEMLELTSTLVHLMPDEAEPAAVAAMVRLAEARRPARIDGRGLMVPLSEQDPQRWQRPSSMRRSAT